MTDTPRETQGYWWCGNCREEVNPRHVTHSELHENCGHPVAWIDPVSADLVKELRQVVRESVVIMKSLKRGDCWCEMATGHPLIKTHAAACRQIPELLRRIEQEPPSHTTGGQVNV